MVVCETCLKDQYWLISTLITFLQSPELSQAGKYDHSALLREATKNWYFLGIFPKPVEKVGFSRPKTIATKISHQV